LKRGVFAIPTDGGIGLGSLMRSMEDWMSSEETGEPFSHCLCCRMPLVEVAAPWLINKEYVRDECVLEYAVCQPCRDVVTELLSEESKASVRRFLESEIDWDARTKEFMLSHDITERFDRCIACRTPRAELEGFGISALFDSGGSLITGALPLLICQPCIGRMTESLSEQSRKVWKTFLAEHFAGPASDHGFPGLL
jgi:hypothetical protein